MRTIFASLLLVSTLTILGCSNKGETATDYKSTNISNMEEVYSFLKNCGTYYIATIDGQRPRVRPFGTVNIFDGKLYIQTGKVKKVAQQIANNGNVEICAFNGSEWIRIETTLKADERREAKESMLNNYPSLKSMYSADDDNTLVLYMTNSTATISSFKSPEKVLKF